MLGALAVVFGHFSYELWLKGDLLIAAEHSAFLFVSLFVYALLPKGTWR